jgi:hypothetical protein
MYYEKEIPLNKHVAQVVIIVGTTTATPPPPPPRNCTPFVIGGIPVMHYLFKFTLALNCILDFWKLLVEFVLAIA